MMAEEASAANVEIVVLASSSEDCAVDRCSQVVLGQPTSREALQNLREASDVITFDHELVSLPVLRQFEAEGAVVRPSADALAHSVDKAHQREAFRAAGLPVPAFHLVRNGDLSGVEDFLESLSGPPVVKTATGGYDGRGVLFPTSRDETLALLSEMPGQVDIVLEERVDLVAEVAQMIARGVSGDVVTYPLVTTVQADGMCNEVRFPSDLDQALHDEADVLTRTIAHTIGLVGVMAVEYFVTPQGLVINELALRPHNSGHWSIEGCETSQFVNHLLAVSGQPLRPTTPQAPAAVMVNVVGADAPGSIADAKAVAGAFVHDYGKSWRPGRKLGHVTVVGATVEEAKVTAWKSARAYGTSTKESS